MLTFQSMKKRDYLKLLGSNMLLLDILFMILRALVPLYVSTRLLWNLMLNPLLITNMVKSKNEGSGKNGNLKTSRSGYNLSYS